MSNTQESPMARFQGLLRELFQFDCADLDFGIYRIMNHKRDVVERFITTKLPETIDAELGSGTLAQQAEVNAALEEAKEQVLTSLGPTALDPAGQITPPALAQTPVARAYLEAKARATGSRSRAALEADTYNHLYAFFNRYYQDGDFVSKRRYSGSHRYAIPYNGEEVYLHWANSDQYYIKTAEYFHSYRWKSPTGATVHFRVDSADVEQNNIKGERRFFVPRTSDGQWDADTRTLTVPFEYRPLNGSEQSAYGRNQQDKIIAVAVRDLPKHFKDPDALAALTGTRRQQADNEPVTHLEHHLYQYTRRNDSDFFIHKDLRGFLARELDFYLKNEVLNLDDLSVAGEHAGDGWFQLLRLVKSIGSQIIDFLAQIEEFQKMLWEKRKFVVEANYCVSMRCVPVQLYPAIAKNNQQWQDWQSLGVLHIGSQEGTVSLETPSQRIDYLKSNPSLMLDTACFDGEFNDQLIASFDDLDDCVDGVVIQGDNWHGLTLIAERYLGKVKCAYIDPPYNTEKDRSTGKFIYKDGYARSSWLAMMFERVTAAKALISDTGCQYTSIDDVMYSQLVELLALVFGLPNHIATVVWQKVHTRKNSAARYSVSHDYIPCFSPKANSWDRVLLPREDTSAYANPDDDPRGPWKPDPIYANNPYDADYTITKPNGVVLHPPPGQYWRLSEASWIEMQRTDSVVWGQGDGYPMVKRFLSNVQDGLVPVTLFDRSFAGDNSTANAELDALFGSSRPFSYPKPTLLVQRLLQTNTRPGEDDCVLDYFAGSGTTGHAVINLNRQDSGNRKFILVEMGAHVDTVLLPRLRKVAFSPIWTDGTAGRRPTAEETERSPRIIKYVRLESYEDALDSIQVDERAAELKLEDRIEGYLLHYMLKWETKESETLLNPAQLANPFDYHLRVHTNGNTVDRPVDVAETFNYLLGLVVRTRRVHMDDDRRYLVFRGETREAPGRTTAVIWRDTTDWDKADLKRDKAFVAEHGLMDDADDVYVNGFCAIAGTRPIEPLFKDRMFAGVSDRP